MITDKRGKQHEVRIEKTFHHGVTGAGMVDGSCVCGWSDSFPFRPEGEGFARWKVQSSAMGHVDPSVLFKEKTDAS